MSNLQGRNNRHSSLRAWLAIAVLALICFVLGRGVWGIYRKNELAENNKKATLIRLADLKERQRNVEVKLEKLRTPEGVEEEIRRALPVAKPGEHVITIVEPDRDTAENEGESSSTPGFWASIIKGL